MIIPEEMDAKAVRAINAAGECNFSGWIVDRARIREGVFEVRIREMPWHKEKEWMGVRGWIRALYAPEDFADALRGAFTKDGDRFDVWAPQKP
jgi:hypothetical protein